MGAGTHCVTPGFNKHYQQLTKGPTTMFKGFGHPKQPTEKQFIGAIVESGLAHYEHIKNVCKDEPDTTQLLAQCVMKFATYGNRKATETNIKFGRICVANAVQRMLDSLRSEGKEEMYSLFARLNDQSSASVA